jgi:hypothetical protein
MSSTSIIFEKPNEALVEKWYRWVFSLNHQSNPFHPIKGAQYWKEKNTDENIIWLAGVTATTQPAKQPSQIPNVKAIVAGAEAKAVYDDGDGNPIQNLPTINPRNITIDKGDNRDLYIPVSTELATATKYPKLVNSLSQLAQEIIDREDDKGAPPAFVEFEDAQGNKDMRRREQLKPEFRVNGTINQLNILADNVGMQPPGNGAAAFSDYALILKRKPEDESQDVPDPLKPGTNTLRFGVDGQFFNYTVEYKIEY